MGSYAECWLGPFCVGATKNDVDPELMGLFRSTDKSVLRGKKHALPFPMRHWLENVGDDEEVSAVFYRTPITVVRDRLELKGYTLDVAKSAFTASCRTAAERYANYIERSGSNALEPSARALKAVDVDQWLASLRTIRTTNLKKVESREEAREAEVHTMSDMFEKDWYGYSGLDLNVPLRLVLEICADEDEFIYDVTDIIRSEYFSVEEDFVCSALAPSSNHYSSNSKRIILTEGRSDSWIISESFTLLCPHLADYFSFMDFDGTRVAGGAGSLANIVKAFAGAGILNRVIAVFDNDTAAETAIRTLRNIRLPENIQILKLPEHAALRKYPTIGPSGPIIMDVNGSAGSIELYLGADVLANEQGELTPVQWAGYEPSIAKYQGEVLFKDAIQKRFKQKLEACDTDRSLLQRNDWSGIRSILSTIVAAFHPLDNKLIHELAVSNSDT
jgi:HEPN/Toprim N-terminal domain 1